MSEKKVDFVLIWVDGNDEEWRKEKAKYSNTPYSDKNLENRYRDWELLRYWFRGVEKFAPWVNNVYFVTCGHYPEWLNFNCDKLKFIKHEDYIPTEHLPTFSSHPIEINLNKIDELSEQFVYFNDDTFLTNNVSEKDFFMNGKPRYIAGCDYVYAKEYDDVFAHILLNNTSIINTYFDKNEVILKNKGKWFNFKYGFKHLLKTILLLPFKTFSGLTYTHLPSPMLKTTMDELWEKEKSIFETTSSHKFRNIRDVNQYIFQWYDIARGNFEPAKNIGKFFLTFRQKDALINSIRTNKYKMIGFSDDLELDFEETKEELKKAFEEILPEKSMFEK